MVIYARFFFFERCDICIFHLLIFVNCKIICLCIIGRFSPIVLNSNKIYVDQMLLIKRYAKCQHSMQHLWLQSFIFILRHTERLIPKPGWPKYTVKTSRGNKPMGVYVSNSFFGGLIHGEQATEERLITVV